MIVHSRFVGFEYLFKTRILIKDVIALNFDRCSLVFRDFGQKTQQVCVDRESELFRWADSA